MPKVTPLSMEDLLSALSENLSAEEILSADILSDLSTQITKERLRRKMTQSQFAELLEVSQGMISKWESKDYNFTIETLCKIAVRLGWRFKALFVSSSHSGFSSAITSSYSHLTTSGSPNYYTGAVSTGSNIIQFPQPLCMEN